MIIIVVDSRHRFTVININDRPVPILIDIQIHPHLFLLNFVKHLI